MADEGGRRAGIARVREDDAEPLGPNSSDFARLLESSKKVVQEAAAGPDAASTIQAFSNLLEKNNVALLEAKNEAMRLEIESNTQRFAFQTGQRAEEFERKVREQELDYSMKSRRTVILGGLSISLTGLAGVIILGALSALTVPLAVPIAAITAAGLGVMAAAGTGNDITFNDVMTGVAKVVGSNSQGKSKPHAEPPARSDAK